MLIKKTTSAIQKLQTFSAFILIGCVAGLQQPVNAQENFKQSYNVKRLDNGDYNLVASKSGTFAGSAKRRWWYENENSSGTAQVDIDLNGGEYDFGITKENSGKTQLKNAATDRKVHFSMKYNIKDEGWWMAGIKTVVSPNLSAWPWSGNHYETYIIENSEKDPSYFEKDKTYWGTRRHNGSKYKFYTNKHKHHRQIFIVRQNYRDSGWIDVGKIFRNDLINLNIVPGNHYVHGFKANVEFVGKNEGYFQLRGSSLATW